MKFSPRQRLPIGYEVCWDEGTEHYVWRSGEIVSDITCDRFAARRGAWDHFHRTAGAALIQRADGSA